MLLQLFDRPWAALDAELVRRFLAAADDEGLMWEAKGTKQPHPDSIRKAVCGFANAQGGYLILGAERQNRAWQLLGVQFSHPEPATWVSSLIAPNGITPVPPFDAKPFNEERQAVVVRVDTLCCTGRPEDMVAALFDTERALRFQALVSEHLQPGRIAGSGIESQLSMHQDCLLAWTASQDVGQGTTVAAIWDGAVAVVLNESKTDYSVGELIVDVRRFWVALVRVVQLFGGTGDAHLAVAVNPKHASLLRGSRVRPRTDVRRWTEAREPAASQVASVVRELERGFGRFQWEPRSG